MITTSNHKQSKGGFISPAVKAVNSDVRAHLPDTTSTQVLNTKEYVLEETLQK